MPELPEVETVCRGLRSALVGRRFLSVEARRPDLRFPFPDGFAARLTGRRVERVDRRAKYILIGLDDATVLLIHLGMSGRVVVAPRPIHRDAHQHVLFRTDDGQDVAYSDARRFGFMDLVAAADLGSHPRLISLGIEPLSPEFDGSRLAGLLAGRKVPLKAALLDQRLIAGIGNIYACEALFRAGLSPRRLARTVSGQRADRLAIAIRQVLGEAIAAGGSSLRDYVQASGELGYFQHRWAVYDREGEVCPGCNGGPACIDGVRRIAQAGRSTFYCPRRQR
ncbi:MAG: bifunctional DNA-formamidopyrimidine glycosylase/DNA-(apurinic or apyrimidinic site) lyase [Alphaproteobacteria bacterium]|nr:bifunctional DNA-formamidopyrimidine glycosylase/DNA-(apurinic or apyrimidinic site) lyase [Alphaproteobacteria bacterium]